MTTPYDSGQFLIPSTWTTTATPACALFDSTLWAVGGDEHGISQLQLALVDDNGHSIDIDGGAATKPGAWTTASVSIPKTSVSYTTKGGLASLATGMYLVWNNRAEHGALRAANYATDGEGKPGWQFAVSLAAAGDPLHRGIVAAPDAEVSALAFGDDTLIVACPKASAWWAHGGQTLYIGTYHVADIDQEKGIWPARNDIWGGPTTFKPPFGPGYTFPDFGNRLSMDWYSGQDTADNSATVPTGQPGFYLWLTLDRQGAGRSSTFVLPLDEATGVSFGKAGYTTPQAQFVVRDPGGRVCTFAGDGAWIDASTYSTWALPSSQSTAPSPSVQTRVAASQVLGSHPAALFYTDQADPLPVSLSETGTAYPVYRFLFYGTNRPCCQISRYGTAEVYPDFGVAATYPADGEGKHPHLDPLVAQTVIIEGIVDGPIPIPNVNLAGEQFSSTTTFGQIQYGRTKSQSESRTVKNSWAAGFKTEGQCTKGFGVAWDVSMSGGPAQVKTDGSSESLTRMLISPTVPDEQSLSSGTPVVLPTGNAFCSQLTLSWTAFRFLDAEGNPVVDGTDGGSNANQAPLYTTVTSRMSSSGPTSFIPYAVTPGDLSSYTIPALNARMQELGYQGDDYFSDVVLKYAYPFKGTAPSEPGLRAAWNNTDTTVSSSYGETATSFVENGWTAKADVYAGISGGVSVTEPIFGLGQDFSWKFLLGVSFEHESTVDRTKSTSWQIGLADGWGAIGQQHKPDMIEKYSFDIYFLPPPPDQPNRWVQELKAYLPKARVGPYGSWQLAADRIDENAQAWKIMFIVTSYNTVDGSVVYPPPH